MLKIFEEYNTCRTVLNPPIRDSDIRQLEEIFSREYEKWIVEFGNLYNIPYDIVILLDKEIHVKKKKISIITHKSKLTRYLHKFGFKVIFISLLKDNIVKTKDIEVILIGGSADSSSKIINIISNISLENLSVVIVQHIENDRVGMFDEVLKQYTKHKVVYAQDGKKIKKGVIYLAPKDRHLKVKDSCFVLSDEESYNFSKPSISLSYESFSSYYKESLLVLQECGHAKDGVDKLKFLKSNNSTLVIQDKDECEAKSMVANAYSISVHDYIFDQNNIIDYINFLNSNGTKEFYLAFLLEMILKKYNYDFRLYHHDMILRRLDVFMIKNEIKEFKDGIGLIIFNRAAFKEFFLSVSINVTEFFRNPVSFKNSIDFLNKQYKKSHNIKLWSAGCSSGEEAYSIAIILDALGILNKSIMYATDFNSVILEDAQNGIYSNKAYEIAKANFNAIGMEDDLANYIMKNDNFVIINEKIREKVLFFQHNLVSDSSFNEFDIIICKNVLIYFSDNLQRIVFKLFYDSLKFGGYLVLGESETIHNSLLVKFERYEDNSKIFKKVS